MSRNRVQLALVGIVAVLALALVGQLGLHFFGNPNSLGERNAQEGNEPKLMAMWKDNPKSIAELKRLSENIVEGRVTRIRRAADLTMDFPGEPGGKDRIPIEAVTIQVERSHKGGQAQTVEVFHTGHSDAISPLSRRPPPMSSAPPKPKGAVEFANRPRPSSGGEEVTPLTLHDDPKYRVGERYLLFLRKGPPITVGGVKTETKAVVAPAGRYRIGAGDTVEPAARAGFATGLKGRTIAQMRAEIAKTP